MLKKLYWARSKQYLAGLESTFVFIESGATSQSTLSTLEDHYSP